MKRKRSTVNGKRSAMSDENVLTLYLKDISRIPLLSREEEDTVARKAAAHGAYQAYIAFAYKVGKGQPLSLVPFRDIYNKA